MAESFILSCESTVDLPYSYVQQRNIPVLFYSYLVEGQEYIDDMGRDPEALTRFYRLLQEGHLPTTSQLNLQTYLDYFETLLSRGDVLHIAFGSGMTNSVANALQAAELLRDKHPERKLVVLDSLCSLPDTDFWWIRLLICGMREKAWMRSQSGCWITETPFTISFIPSI